MPIPVLSSCTPAILMIKLTAPLPAMATMATPPLPEGVLGRNTALNDSVGERTRCGKILSLNEMTFHIHR